MEKGPLNQSFVGLQCYNGLCNILQHFISFESSCHCVGVALIQNPDLRLQVLNVGVELSAL